MKGEGASYTLSAEEHAMRILMDATAPASARTAAARWLADASGERSASQLQQLLLVAGAGADDDLWATLLELLAGEHPDSRIVWAHFCAALARCDRLNPLRTAKILRSLIQGGVPAGEVATALSSAIGDEGALPALVWLFASSELPSDIPGPLRTRLEKSIVELDRSTLMFHLLAICRSVVRAALGQSGAYTRYRRLYWTLQDWPYGGRGDLDREVRRGAIDEREAEALGDFGSRLCQLLETWSQEDAEFKNPDLHAELSRLGEGVLARLGVQDELSMLFPSSAHGEHKK